MGLMMGRRGRLRDSPGYGSLVWIFFPSGQSIFFHLQELAVLNRVFQVSTSAFFNIEMYWHKQVADESTGKNMD
jgi:hypothetical protein